MERGMVLCGLVVQCALLSVAAIVQAEWMPGCVLVATTSIDVGTWLPHIFNFIIVFIIVPGG